MGLDVWDDRHDHSQRKIVAKNEQYLKKVESELLGPKNKKHRTRQDHLDQARLF